MEKGKIYLCSELHSGRCFAVLNEEDARSWTKQNPGSNTYQEIQVLDKNNLPKHLMDELFNIGKNMPVFAGNLNSHQGAQELIDLGLAMRYEGDYVLTELGKEKIKEIKLQGAKMLADKSVVNQWCRKDN
jgi:hypothetical protein